MVCLCHNDWRKDLGLPDEPTEEQIRNALEALREWYQTEERLEDERRFKREKIERRFTRLSRRERARRQAEIEALMPALYVYGVPVQTEFDRRWYVILLGLDPDATEPEIIDARRERVHRHFAVRYGFGENASPFTVMDAVYRHLLTLQRELHHLEEERDSTWEAAQRSAERCNALESAIEELTYRLHCLRTGLPEYPGRPLGPLGCTTLSLFEEYLATHGGPARLPRPWRKF